MSNGERMTDAEWEAYRAKHANCPECGRKPYLPYTPGCFCCDQERKFVEGDSPITPVGFLNWRPE